MEIVDLTVEDLPKALEIEKISFALPWSPETFRDEILNGRYFAARENGNIIGYVGYQEVSDEANINNLAVHPGFRRKGIGKKLIKKIIEDAGRAGIKKLMLEFRESNAAARKLYEKFGFKVVGRRKDYYPEPREDAILMTKELEG